MIARGARRRDQARRCRARALHGRCRRRAARVGRARVPRPARARPHAAARSRARRPGAHPAARALPAHPRRRVPGHRPDPGRAGGAARLGRSRRRYPARGPRSTSTPGRLFFVGDPKQSIYRFRRADIATFLAAADRFADGGAPEQLTVQLPHVGTGARVDQPRVRRADPAVSRLAARVPGARPGPAGAARQPPAHGDVVLLGVEPHADGPDADGCAGAKRPTSRRSCNASSTRHGRCRTRAPSEWRPARLGDVCILLPARTSLGFLERALDDAGVPYRAETSSLVYGSREVRDLLAALRAIDDPSDALVARHRVAVVAVRLRRRRPLRLPRRARRPLGRSRLRRPSRLPRRPSRRRRDARSSARPARGAACGRRRASCSSASCASVACSRSRRSADGSATSPGVCGSSSTRPARSPTRPAARCATTSRGPSCRAPKARGSSRRCCPRPTTTPCGS